MKQFLILTIAFCFILVSSAFGQDVAIFHDAKLMTLSVNNAAGFANLLVKELGRENINAEIVDSAGLAAYMEANPEGIMLVCQGIFPGTVFANEGEDDLIHSWLRDGGIGGFVGDYPFYYWDNTDNKAKGDGQKNVFGAQVTNSNTAIVKPTELGEKYIPSLQEEWTTNRPVGLAALETNGFEFESYADDGSNADPIAYRTRDMKGWFINFHTSCCGTAIPPNEQMAKEYAELIFNRFIDQDDLQVDSAGKLNTLWGRLKAKY